MILHQHEALKIQIVCKSACQFVYRRTLGAICRTRNNKGPILSPPTWEPAIQTVTKYGMRAAYMLYKISCPYFIKVHIWCYKNFMSIFYKRTYLVCSSPVNCFSVWYCNKRIKTSPSPILLIHRHEALKIQIVRKSACQFVYRGTLGAICRA